MQTPVLFINGLNRSLKFPIRLYNVLALSNVFILLFTFPFKFSQILILMVYTTKPCIVCQSFTKRKYFHQFVTSIQTARGQGTNKYRNLMEITMQRTGSSTIPKIVTKTAVLKRFILQCCILR